MSQMLNKAKQIKPQSGSTASRGNALIGLVLGAVVFGMVGVAYAAVPLYQLFCQVTGYGGTIRSAGTSAQKINGLAASTHQINVRFDANVAPDLNWEFKPLQRQVALKMGEQKQVAYSATNRSSVPVTASATFNVTPLSAGLFFNKLECFCFTETTLQPGESMEMPVLFFVDPEMINSAEASRIKTITLSYSFFKLEDKDMLEKKPIAGVDEKNIKAGQSG